MELCRTDVTRTQTQQHDCKTVGARHYLFNAKIVLKTDTVKIANELGNRR